MKTWTVGFLVVFLATVLLFGTMTGAEKEKSARVMSKPTGTPVSTYFNINNLSTVLFDNGWTDIDVNDQNAGLVYPIGSGKTAAFQSGFLWGGMVGGKVLVGGSAYRTGLQTGKIKPDRTPEDPNLPKNRIYRVRRDVYPGGPTTVSFNGELLSHEGAVADIRAQYEKDWNEWPWQDGAPYEDKNHNGRYDPAVDIPGVTGADQTIWFVANDLNPGVTTQLYGSSPIGIEVQITAWGYAQTGALGNTIFRKYLFINRSASRIDSMYVSQWSDIDLGNATDDYAGCDTTRSLGYTYNANAIDAVYSPLPPPATGFDFLQGPIVPAPGETAIFKGAIRNNYKNLPMTAFYYFARGDATVTDPTQGDYEGTTQFYNFFRGKIGKTGQEFTDPNGVATPFALAGDPQTGKGWLDGQILPSGDRRQGLASGPFTMAPGDTQEVVVAEIVAGAIPGTDRLSAIGLLKFYDDQAQLAYNVFFDLPVPPPPPTITVTELDKEIILNWDSDAASVAATENSNSKGYLFQGYNLYQLPTASSTIADATRLLTYDIADGVGKIEDKFFDPKTGVVAVGVKQFGNDTGIKRFADITTDVVKGGTPLIDGIKYYFAVTAYNFNPENVVPNNLETPIKILTVVPHSANPGVQLSASTGKSFTSNVTHATGIADATITVAVTDPTKLNGSSYTVGFHTRPFKFTVDYVPPDPILTNGTVTLSGTFTIMNEAETQVAYNLKLIGLDSLTGPITSTNFRDASPGSVGGKAVKTITFVPQGAKIALASGVWSSTDAEPLTKAWINEMIVGNIYVSINTAAHPLGEVDAWGSLNQYPWYLNRGSTRILSYQQNYSLDSAYFTTDGFQLKVGNLTFLAPITFFKATQTVKAKANTPPIVFWGDGQVFGDVTGLASELFGGGGSATQTDLVQDLEFRFTGVPDPSFSDPDEAPIISGGSIATIRSRSSATATARIRIPFELWEVERNRQINVALTDRNAGSVKSPWGDTGTPRWYRINGRTYIVPVATPYDSDTSHAKTSVITRTAPNSTWAIFFDDGENASTSHWDTGDKFVLVYANNVVPGTDTYTFSMPSGAQYSADKAKNDISQVNVFPNPYLGVNSEELNKYQRFVTFTHLPDVATIRIFNLAGVMLRKIEHNSPGSQFERWDLANESGLPVGSGVYIAYIEMPTVGGATKILKIAVIQEQQILDRF